MKSRSTAPPKQIKFRSVLSALEFYFNHRSCGQSVSLHAIITAIDIEKILDRFPLSIQKALFDFAYNGISTPFTPATLRLLKNKLNAAGYMKNSHGAAISGSQAA